MPMRTTTCSGCGDPLPDENTDTPQAARPPCPRCGSTARTFGITLTDSAVVYDGLRTQARHGQRGQVKPFHETYDDVLWNHDRERLERRIMIYDHEHDYYKQEWRDLNTGELTWGPKEGQRSDPNMHGKSARRRREQPE